MARHKEQCGYIIEFNYTYKNHENVAKSFLHPIEIPFKEDVNELAHEIVAARMEPIMKYLEAEVELLETLKQFVSVENQKFYDTRDEDVLAKARNGQMDIDAVIRDLEKQYREEILEFADRIGPPDEEIFAQSFHRLVHSSSLPDILVKEKNYAKTISDLMIRMTSEIELLNQGQQDEMETKIQQLDVSTTSEDINHLLSQQYATQNLVRKKWESELEANRGHQKIEYRSWITSQIGEYVMSSPVPTPIGNRSSMFLTQTPSMEESFTIHLGSQLKHMHNIRILSANVTELCGPLHIDESLSGLNMALGLYSSSLCGVVVLTPSGSVQVNTQVINYANMSSEFHFDQVDNQIEKIKDDLKKLNENKTCTTSNGNGGGISGREKLKPGDFFITRHSNLAQSHVIFHLIADEPYNSPGEINSRHPVILGLRNILKCASRHDVTTLTIPALLRHEMSEDMTVSWCMRRAELVFKCAKGFMIESATWGGAELSTLQLLLPRDISEELFTTLSGMVPHVFRVANPKILEDTSK